jgi:hypothetical protein
MGMSANVGRTGTDFQWTLRIVNGLLARWRHLAAARICGTIAARVRGKQKGRRKAGLS